MSGPIAYIQVRWRKYDDSTEWSYVRLDSDATSVTLKGLTRGVAYVIQARSVGPSGLKSVWVDISHTMADNPVPDIPQDLVAVDTADGIYLTWSYDRPQPPSTVSCVERALDVGGPFTEILIIDGTVALVSEVDNEIFYYRVRSKTYQGLYSDYSAVVSGLPSSLTGAVVMIPLAIVAGVVTVDCSIGQSFSLDLTEDAELQFINVPLHKVVLIQLTQRGAFDLTLPTNVTPDLGIAYVTTKTVDKTDALGFLTDSAGVYWRMRFDKYSDPIAAGILTTVITPNPAYAFASANPSVAVSASTSNNVGSVTYTWSRAAGGVGDWGGSSGNTGGADFTCSSTSSATPTFSRTGTADGYVAQNWLCHVEDSDSPPNVTNTVLEIALEDDALGGGGSGGWECPHEDEYLPAERIIDQARQAKDIKVGDLIWTIDPKTFIEYLTEVTRATRAKVECVKVHTESGVTFRSSTTAPIATMAGYDEWAENLFGKSILVKKNGRYIWSKVNYVEFIGMQWVIHITAASMHFLMGDVPGEYVGHHNIKYTP